jgi:NAD(P)-dependent dehydrogenase (short-subunit alcohol dehydrogenase family)
VVVGVGPGTGGAVARRFARGGYRLGLIARGKDHVRAVADAIAKEGGKARSFAADAADPASLEDAFAGVREALGPVEVLVYNAGAFRIAGLLELSPQQLEEAWRIGCLGAFVAARQVLPDMIARERGTILLTGATASRRGSARFAALAVPKFGLRALAESMAREFAPQGIHVAHVVIDGVIDTPAIRRFLPDREPETLLSPESIAETYWELHRQNRSSWTLELDLRPAVEKF